MFPLKHAFFGLSGAGLVGGSLAAWQLTKNNNLNTEKIEEYGSSDFHYIDEDGDIDVLNSEIGEICGEDLGQDWYDEEGSYNVVTKSDGTIDTEQGYKRKNSKGKDAENYPTCASEIFTKREDTRT